MSRRQGRFSTHQNAGESLQRQLTAPAHKWRKAWVAPNGTQPESTYKICRYVKIAKDEKDIEDDVNEEGEEDEEEGEGDEEGEDEGEGEGEEDAEGEEGKTPAGEVDTPAVPNPEPTSSAIPTPTALTSEVTPAPTADPDPSSTPIQDETPPITAIVPTPPTNPETTHSAIPSNAIEMTNTAPNHVEDGNPTTHTQEAGIEITQPQSPSQAVQAAPTAIGSLGQNEDKMDVDSPTIGKGETVEEDVGLVMGEMTPPVGQKELEVPAEDGDGVKETETEVMGSVEGVVDEKPPQL